MGKLPHELLAELLAAAPLDDADVVVGPGIGFDCAVVSVGDRYLVFKSDPITFATDELGWYLVQVNVNDLATTGARPRWMLVTLLLPERATSRSLVSELSEQIYGACRNLGIAVVGGHTEVTYGLERPIAVGALIGEVSPDKLVTPAGMTPGDKLILTKGVPIEATSILAREFAERLEERYGAKEIERAANYLYDPGISVFEDAQTALAAGRVTAMHDPTEGGLAAALWEIAEAAQMSLVVEPQAIPVPALAAKVCSFFDIDPLAAIASGALLLAVRPDDAGKVLAALEEKQIVAAIIGEAEEGAVNVWQKENGRRAPLDRPERDAIAQLFETLDG
ncbi:MAG: AIR synthase family protein [Chloroflexota bacterium]